MDYSNLSREQLIKRIQELEMLNSKLTEAGESKVGFDYPLTGNLGDWKWDLQTHIVQFRPIKAIVLGYDESEIKEPVSFEFFTEKIYVEDYSTVRDSILALMLGEIDHFEVEYRIRTKDSGYRWFYDTCEITSRDESGKPLHATGMTQDITEKREMQLELYRRGESSEKEIFEDPLTHVSNRYALTEKLKLEIISSQIDMKFLTIALFEIDDFIRINETEGHIYGDHVLRRIADIIRENKREKDIVGRFGAEKFMIIFTETPQEIAYDVAENIKIAIETYDFGVNLSVKVHYGIKEYLGEDADELIAITERKTNEKSESIGA